MNCLNCDTSFKGNFCPNCGQKSNISRFNLQTFSNTVITSTTDTNKGFLYNLKTLTLKPGKVINDYLDGKRVNIFNPISYLLVAVSAYLIISNYLGIDFKPIISDVDIENNKIPSYGYKTGYFVAKNAKYIFPFNAIYFGVFTWLFLKKRNLFEHIIINCFVVGHAIFIGILSYPIIKLPIVFDPIIYITIVVLYFSVFKKYSSKLEIFLGAIFTLFLGIILFYLFPFLLIYIFDLF